MVEKLKLSTTISNVLSNKLDTFDFSIMFIIERPHEQAHYKKVYTVQKKIFFFVLPSQIMITFSAIKYYV